MRRSLPRMLDRLLAELVFCALVTAFFVVAGLAWLDRMAGLR